MIHRPTIRRRLSHGLFTAALAAGACIPFTAANAAEAQFQYVSQSVIVMRGIPPTRRAKAEPKPAQEVTAAASQDDVPTLTAEERRLLRYGVDEESSRLAAEAERKIVEEAIEPEPEPVIAEASVGEPVDPPVRPAAFSDSNTTVKIEAAPPRARTWESPAGQKADPAAVERMGESQRRSEAPGGGSGQRADASQSTQLEN